MNVVSWHIDGSGAALEHLIRSTQVKHTYAVEFETECLLRNTPQVDTFDLTKRALETEEFAWPCQGLGAR